jgi:hypothetical protein
MNDRVAQIAAAKLRDGTWFSELEDTIDGLETELEQAEHPRERQRLRYELATRRDQLERRRIYAETLPRIDIGGDG